MPPTPTELVERFYNVVWNNADEAEARRLLDAAFRFRASLGPELHGPDGFIDYLRSVHAALEGFTCHIDEIVAADDRVAARMRFHGLHRAEFFGIAPTGREIGWSGAAFIKTRGGKITELWVLGDVEAVRRQLEPARFLRWHAMWARRCRCASFSPRITRSTKRSRFACSKGSDTGPTSLAMDARRSPINYNSESWFAIANLSQYLFVKDDPATVAEKLKSGQVINGIGIFGRVGYAPADTNTVVRDASVALVAHGLYDARQYDSFGVGWYWNEFSNYLKDNITTLTEGMASAKNESGIEAFYDFAVTPAIRFIPSHQHIWNPLAAQVANNQNKADVFLARLTVAF